MDKRESNQARIDAYELYMEEVEEAVKFVEIGSGKHPAIGILKLILEKHSKDCLETIDEINKNEE